MVCLGVLVGILTSAGKPANGATIAVGPGEGYDFDNIQAGIDAAIDGDTVLVAPGEYVLTEPVTFGGKVITVKSEAGPDATIIRMGTPTDSKRASVVVFENNETAASVLEGFTITGGRGNWVAGAGGWVGGGIYSLASSATLKDCAIVGNNAPNGGGLMCEGSSSPTLIGCVIAENASGGVGAVLGASPSLIDCIIAGNSSGDYAGGASCWNNASVTLANCIIADNSAGLTGAGVMGSMNSSIIITNSVLTGNTAELGVGGGIHLSESRAEVTNCVITNNTAGSGGGGLGCAYESSLKIRNCTIWGNTTMGSYYPGFAGGGIGCFSDSSAEITNSVVWGNTSPTGDQIAATQGASTLTVTYSNVAGGQAKAHIDSGCTLNWAEGNIDADPLFARPGYWADAHDPNVAVEPHEPDAVWIDGDYHLRSETGRWDPGSESWVQDEVTSPCIDRGDPNSPIDDEPDPNSGTVNMGAYGGTPKASMSIGMLPPLPPLAHWKLDETEGHITFDHIGRNDGILVGDPIWHPEAGRIAGALELDGSTFVATAHVLDPADGPFSVLAWVKGDVPGQVIVSQTDGENWLCTNPTDGSLMTELKSGSRSARVLYSDTIITDGAWHRIGFTWDDSSRRLYVDEVLVAEDTQSYLASCFGGLKIGTGYNMAPGTYWTGLIDDVRIYNRAVRP